MDNPALESIINTVMKLKRHIYELRQIADSYPCECANYPDSACCSCAIKEEIDKPE